MEIKEVSNCDESLIRKLCQVWESSVRSTHLFLSEDDIINISKYVPLAIEKIPVLLIAVEADHPIAFMGVNAGKLEMLFVDSKNRGNGIGKKLVMEAVNHYKVSEVCVNEQNFQAQGFYEHMGFVVYRRSDLDEQGNPFPILYMHLKCPDFENIKSYSQFCQYYWYREELKQICKQYGIAHNGTKAELNNNIKEYFNGKIIKPVKRKKVKKKDVELTLDTKVLECGFVMNGRFREYFSEITGISNFKFTADMAAALKKARNEQDENFTINDLLAVYQGQSDYAKYDNSSCQWNQFLKDFCKDSQNNMYKNKLKATSILWKIVKNQAGQKIYSSSLVKEYASLLKEYIKDENLEEEND